MILDDGNVRMEVVRSAPEALELLATYSPGSKPPPVHYHPRQEETFEVRRGRLRFTVDGVTRVLGAGERIVVPARSPHAAQNDSRDEETVVTWLTRPALRTQQLFAAVYEVTRARSGLLGMAAVMRHFSDELVLAKPPRLVQTCIFGLLAPLARVLGKAPPLG